MQSNYYYISFKLPDFYSMYYLKICNFNLNDLKLLFNLIIDKRNCIIRVFKDGVIILSEELSYSYFVEKLKSKLSKKYIFLVEEVENIEISNKWSSISAIIYYLKQCKYLNIKKYPKIVSTDKYLMSNIPLYKISPDNSQSVAFINNILFQHFLNFKLSKVEKYF